jgi:hypothetical protein
LVFAKFLTIYLLVGELFNKVVLNLVISDTKIRTTIVKSFANNGTELETLAPILSLYYNIEAQVVCPVKSYIFQNMTICTTYW